MGVDGKLLTETDAKGIERENIAEKRIVNSEIMSKGNQKYNI